MTDSGRVWFAFSGRSLVAEFGGDLMADSLVGPKLEGGRLLKHKMHNEPLKQVKHNIYNYITCLKSDIVQWLFLYSIIQCHAYHQYHAEKRTWSGNDTTLNLKPSLHCKKNYLTGTTHFN